MLCLWFLGNISVLAPSEVKTYRAQSDLSKDTFDRRLLLFRKGAHLQRICGSGLVATAINSQICHNNGDQFGSGLMALHRQQADVRRSRFSVDFELAVHLTCHMFEVNVTIQLRCLTATNCFVSFPNRFSRQEVGERWRNLCVIHDKRQSAGDTRPTRTMRWN